MQLLLVLLSVVWVSCATVSPSPPEPDILVLIKKEDRIKDAPIICTLLQDSLMECISVEEYLVRAGFYFCEAVNQPSPLHKTGAHRKPWEPRPWAVLK
jgi:hypothetical protein